MFANNSALTLPSGSLVSRWRVWRSAKATAKLSEERSVFCGAPYVRALIAHGGDPNARRDGGVTPLMYAVTYMKSEVVEVLLQGGADPNVPCVDGVMLKEEVTPLMQAIRLSSLEIVGILLKYGANPNAHTQWNEGVTPLAYAREPEIVATLLSHGATVPAMVTAGNGSLEKGNFWYDLFMSSVVDSDHAVPIARMLFESVPERDRKQILETAFDWFEMNQWECVEMLELLLSLGAGVNRTDDQQQTPLHRAAERRRASLVDCLLRCGANPAQVDEVGMTPLHLCVEYAQCSDADEIMSIIRLLADHGADVNACDSKGRTALAMIDNEMEFVDRPSVRARLERIRECLLSFDKEKAERLSSTLDADLPELAPARAGSRL